MNFKKILKNLSITVAFGLLLNISLPMHRISASTTEQKLYIDETSNSYITYRQPASNWNPLKASQEELEYYGYPDKPINPEQLEQWEKAVTSKWSKPDIAKTKYKHDTNLKDTKNNSSENTNYQGSTSWAGYVKSSTCYGASSSWQVPTVSAPSTCLAAYSSQWVGLGGYNSNKLAQIGNRADVTYSGTTQYYIWYELINTSFTPYSELKISNLSCSGGDSIYASVKLRSSSGYGYVDFYISNSTRGQSTSFTIQLTSYSGLETSAEWISERPNVSGLHYYPLTSAGGYKCVPFWSPQFQKSSGGSWTTLADASDVDKVVMSRTGGPVLATPSSIRSTGSFDVNWNNY